MSESRMRRFTAENMSKSQRELGAFYTPPLYAQKALELVREAIRQVPDGNDYVIIDRCAGSGNLQEAMTEQELSHCILNTYEYFEYLVLREHFGDKVREIIPPTTDDDYEAVGKVKGSNALDWANGVHPIMKPYLDNPNCTIILFENPPYRDETSNTSGTAKKNIGSFVRNACTLRGAEKNDVCNQFIWSAFKYYLRQSTDAYIVFAPIKYNKSIGMGGRYMNGYLFNRKHFHASPAAISCISWRKSETVDTEFDLTCYDIVDNELKRQGNITVKHCNETLSVYFDTRRSEDYIAFATISGFLIGPVNIGFYRSKLQLRGHGSPCCIYADNYLEKLPMFVAKGFPASRWQERDFVFTTSDKGDAYIKDRELLKCCFIWTCLSQKNHCLSFDGSDGRFYRNELCFDNGTLASNDLKKHRLNKDEEKLLKWWQTLLRKVKRTKEYNERYTYGLYQIEKEINIRNEDKEYVYPDIHNDIQALKVLLKAYYEKYLVKKLFEYELLK